MLNVTLLQHPANPAGCSVYIGKNLDLLCVLLAAGCSVTNTRDSVELDCVAWRKAFVCAYWYPG